jgi:hypothetical protein
MKFFFVLASLVALMATATRASLPPPERGERQGGGLFTLINSPANARGQVTEYRFSVAR